MGIATPPVDMKRLARIASKHGGLMTQAGESGLRFKYGITQADVAALLVKQNGYCDDCGCDLELVKNWCIDHSHTTGKIRGLLCYSCNTAIRNVDKMLRHVAYLRKHGEEI